MSDTPTELHNNDRKVLVDHFRGKEFNDKMVADFCTRNKIAMTDAGNVQDFIYQTEYDERMLTVYPLVMAELATLKFNAEYISDEELAKISAHNDQISVNIAQILEDNGVLYSEFMFLETLGNDCSQLLQSAYQRISNMASTVLAEMAQEKLGRPLTIKALADERAQIADRKFKEQEAKGEVDESEKAEPQPDAETPAEENTA